MYVTFIATQAVTGGRLSASASPYIVYGFYEPKGCQIDYRTFTDLNEAREYYYMLIITLQNECDEVYLDEFDEDGDIENLDCHRFETDSEDESE